MMTDLASLLSAATGLVGDATNGSLIGLAGTASAAGALGSSPAGPIAATTFQMALAVQARISAPIVQPAPFEPGNAGVFATIMPTLDPGTKDETLAAASPLPARAVPALAALALPKPPLAAPTTSPVPAPPIGIALPEAPDTATPAFKMLAPVPDASVQPVPASAYRGDDGKLPSDGKILPVIPMVTAPKAAPQPHVDKVEIEATDDRSTSQADATDAPPQPLPTLAPVIVPTLPTVFVERPPTSPAQTRRTIGSIIPAAVPALPITPSAIGAAPLPQPGATVPPLAFAALPAPIPALPVAPAAASPTMAVPSAAISPPPAVADVGTSGAAVTLQPVVIALANPALAQAAPPTLPTTTPSTATLSTASRLARQSGVMRPSDPATPLSDSASAPTPVAGVLAAPLDPANATATTTPVAATPPQDFAALVDRLLEARASAQSSSPPQQVSTSVTHADFGKVSLSFRHDVAGLSVSMTSADPGFAHAAQSAIAGSSNVSGATGTSLAVTADQLSGAHVAGNQHLAADAGSFGQGFAQPDARGQVTPGVTGQSSAGFPASGGSQQSQAQAQPQPQPQQRPGLIAAASRLPAASNSTAGSAATGHGIFA